MKNLYEKIRLRIANPSGVDVIVAALVAIIFGNLTGEVVSREYNSYFQASMLLGTVTLSFIAVRMFAMWLYNFVNSKNK